MQRQPNLCVGNSYFDIVLNAWQTNVDIQPVVNEYKTFACMCQDFKTTKDQCSQVMKQGVNEAFESTIHHLDTMKIIPKTYLGNRKCSVQEAVYHILSDLKIRRIFLAVYFVNADLPIKRGQVLFSEKELSELPWGSSHIFKKSNTDVYMRRPNATFFNGKHSVSNNFCQAAFLAYCTLENQSNKAWEYHQHELDDKLIENNREECSYNGMLQSKRNPSIHGAK